MFILVKIIKKTDFGKNLKNLDFGKNLQKSPIWS